MSNKSLTNTIRSAIIHKNYISLEAFLKLALYDKNFGFYNNNYSPKDELIGSKGHFITSPEISQMFGELLAIWLIDFIEKIEIKTVNLIELGPGKGTLIHDILRVISNFKSKKINLNLHFLETSNYLTKVQQEKLKNCNLKKNWYKTFKELERNLNNFPTIFLANEFFDSLPICQYKFQNPHKLIKMNWKKIVIKYKNNMFFFDENEIDDKDEILIKSFYKKFDINCFKNNEFLEFSKMTNEFLKKISFIINKFNGGAIFVDYGKNNPFGNTLQSVSNNKKISFFEKIGHSDYSSLVDFSNFSYIGNQYGLNIFPIVSQRQFLLNLGIFKRAENLAMNASINQKRKILSDVDRLISKKHMGEIFKVFVMSKHNIQPLGLDF